MSPSSSDEVNKKNLASLLEAYLEKAEIDYWGLGSITLHQPEKTVGKEPDEYYCLGIEVVLSSGGIDCLAVYQRLAIPEVCFWLIPV